MRRRTNNRPNWSHENLDFSVNLCYASTQCDLIRV